MLRRLNEKSGLNATLNTTEDCNLRCKYCYEINKQKKELPLEYAKKFVDIILKDPDPIGAIASGDEYYAKLISAGLTFDFIGGDSLINVKWLDECFEYILEQLYTKCDNQRYKENFKFSLTTNGTLFLRKSVKEFCEKYKDFLKIGISIDGCPEIHDLNRVYRDGRGTIEDILKNWEWYKNFTDPSGITISTKSTLSKSSVPFIYKSLVFMHKELGINYINQNFIMENSYCKEEDYIELVKQLNRCIEYVLENRNEICYTIFDTLFLNHKNSYNENRGHCGSGAMPCLGINGNIYPCFRWMPHTQSKCNPEPIIVGDIWKGLYNKDGFRQVREGAYRCNCTKEEKCKACPYESACSYCIGGCYAEFQEFRRTTYICELTKIQCEYAKRYWNEYNKLENILDENGSIKYYPIDRHYDVDKYYYDPEHIYNPE